MKKKEKIVPRNLMHLELIKSGALKPKTTRDKTKYSRKQKHKGGETRPYHIKYMQYREIVYAARRFKNSN